MSLHKEDQEFPIADAVQNAILMHRDAHFGGKFEIMLDYYQREGKGMCPDFDLETIHKLALIEENLHENLAGVLLSGSEAEQVAEAKVAYKSLRDLYDSPKNKGTNGLLIADLILSEDDEPEDEIEAIVAKKGEIVPALIALLKSEKFYNPVFPGYGLAPALAAKCLGLIGDKRSIITLFESIGESDFFNDDVSIKALKMIGLPARDFLLKVLQKQPLNEDNEKAAIALIQFEEDQEVAKACLNMLKNVEVRKDISLATYLILACEHLKDKECRSEFMTLLDDPQTPAFLHQDFKAIIKGW